MAGSTLSGAGPDTPGTSRTSFSDDEYWKDDLFSMVPVAVSCVPENQGLFDDDGWMSTPLIDRSHVQLYSNYRYAYAEMLQMWGQPLSRLEIMKFDVLKEDKLSSNEGATDNYDEDSAPNNTPFYPTGATSPTSPFADRRGLFQELLTSGRGVDVTGFCRVHPGVPLEPAEYLRPSAPTPPSTANPSQPTNAAEAAALTSSAAVNGTVGVCHRCTAEREHTDLVPQTELDCGFCWQPVVGLYAACRACGCVTHEGCLAEWHALGGVECPGAHECCSDEEASSEGAGGSWAGLRDAAVAAAAAAAAAADDAAAAVLNGNGMGGERGWERNGYGYGYGGGGVGGDSSSGGGGGGGA
jgi:hypothetical protein